MSGQITKETELGKELFKLASDRAIQSFCEVGTWKGYGSTRCLVEGCLTRSPAEMKHLAIYSLEANRGFYDEAAARWAPQNIPFLNLLYGKLHDNGIMTREEITTHPFFSVIKSHYDLWYEQDVKDYNACPNVVNKLPTKIDMVLIDGGEFCGYADWLALQKLNPKIVALDDVNVLKTNRIYNELLTDKQRWTLFRAGNDRNGWAIFKSSLLK
jgi:hypothetical protein